MITYLSNPEFCECKRHIRYLMWLHNTVKEFCEDSRVIPNDTAIEMLYRVFVLDCDKDRVVELFCKDKKTRSYFLRILSTKHGIDTSRRTLLRKFFGQFMVKIGLNDPFSEYQCPPSKRRIARPVGFGLETE